MKQIRKSNPFPRPLRTLASACLLLSLSCAGGNARPTDYWGGIYDVQGNHQALVSLSSEKVVDARGTKVSFVMPRKSIEELDRRSDRYDEIEKRTETLYMRHILIEDVPFGIRDGKQTWSRLGISYSIDAKSHHYVVTFDESMDPSPEIESYPGTREAFPNEFAKLLEKLGQGKIHSVNLLVETSGIPTTAFAIPLDEDGREMGHGPWGRIVAGMSFNPGSLELVTRPIVVVPEGKSREESLEALVEALDRMDR